MCQLNMVTDGRLRFTLGNRFVALRSNLGRRRPFQPASRVLQSALHRDVARMPTPADVHGAGLSILFYFRIGLAVDDDPWLTRTSDLFGPILGLRRQAARPLPDVPACVGAGGSVRITDVRATGLVAASRR